MVNAADVLIKKMCEVLLGINISKQLTLYFTYNLEKEYYRLNNQKGLRLCIFKMHVILSLTLYCALDIMELA